MFDSLSIEQIEDIQSETKRIKHDILRKAEYLITADLLIEITVSKYITQLKTLKKEVNNDVITAAKIYTIYSMDDRQFLDFKKKFKNDYQKIGEFYGVSENYPKLRYQLLLQKKRKLLSNLDIDNAVDVLSKQILLKNR